MNNLKSMETKLLFQEFQICTQLQYNGQLKIQTLQGKSWIFYYSLGQLVWATGGIHPSRRLRRNIAQFCPQIDTNKLSLSSEDTSLHYWDYQLLENLHQAQKIQLNQINAIAESTISELLFDLVQHLNFNSFVCERNQEVILEAPISSISANMFLQQMQNCWNNWSKAGLASLSPDLAPVLLKPEKLRQQVSPNVYKNFENLINGKHTLWDLAVKMKQSVLSVSRSLLPYIQQGITKLVEVPDLPLAVARVKNSHMITHINSGNIPLVACVDDSPQVCQILERIITSNGMRFLKIQDPLQALPILIQNKPDLIFLDLMMPGMNGYELCTSLRRTSAFANTPLAILTGSNGAFDRARAKVFGATDFINKPISIDKIWSIVDKYLSTAPKNVHLSNSCFLPSVNDQSLCPSS
ncbi:response regulator [Anabaena sp. WFMT]|uniref:response regulator n=1 Tax=Anabaena sp. WFMT TaxID=3449730 RepID=UPI003F29266B